MSAYTGFELIINPTRMPVYGGIPETPIIKDSSYELYEIGAEEERLLLADFAAPINEACGTWLDLGDTDYFDYKHRCPILRQWLVEHLEQNHPQALNRAYKTLLNYTNCAIELKTGVLVTL